MKNLQNFENKLDKLVKEDHSEKRNVGTFTAIHKNPFVYKHLFHYLNKNVVDRKGYKSLAHFEDVIENYFKKIFEHTSGTSVLTSGSTESILLAFHYAKVQAWYEKHLTKPNILIPKHAHYSLKRCAKMLDVEVREIDLDENFSTDIQKVKENVDENTILIVGIMISTELGIIDNIQALNDIARENKTYLHIDAAIGGFMIPYLDTDIPYKFSQLDRLFSMNISCHKFGLSLCGGGALLLRDKKITERYTGSIEYLSSGAKKMASLTVTGSSLAIFSLYTNIMLYGFKGYKKFAKKYLQVKKELMEILQGLGFSSFPGSPYSPQIFVYGKDVVALSKYLEEQGWLQHAYKVHGLKQEGFRIVIKKDQEETLLEEFLNDVSDFRLLTTQKLLHSKKNFPRTNNLTARIS